MPSALGLDFLGTGLHAPKPPLPSSLLDSSTSMSFPSQAMGTAVASIDIKTAWKSIEENGLRPLVASLHLSHAEKTKWNVGTDEQRSKIHSTIFEVCTSRQASKLKPALFSRLIQYLRVHLYFSGLYLTPSRMNGLSPSSLLHLFTNGCCKFRMVTEWLHRTFGFFNASSSFDSTCPVHVSVEEIFRKEIIDKCLKKVVDSILQLSVLYLNVADTPNVSAHYRSVLRRGFRVLSKEWFLNSFRKQVLLPYLKLVIGNTKNWVKSLLPLEHLTTFLTLGKSRYRRLSSLVAPFLRLKERRSFWGRLGYEIFVRHHRCLLAPNTGLVRLLKEKDTEGLALVYRSYCASPECMDTIKQIFRSQIRGDARAIGNLECHEDLGGLIQMERDAVKLDQIRTWDLISVGQVGSQLCDQNSIIYGLVTRLLNLLQRYEDIIENSFEKCNGTRKAVRKGLCNAFCFEDENGSWIAQALAFYAHRLLLKTTKKSETPSEWNRKELLANVVKLASSLNSEQFFEDFQELLSNRLLLGTSNSIELEMSFAIQLSRSCPVSRARRLQKMVEDIRNSVRTSWSFARSVPAVELSLLPHGRIAVPVNDVMFSTLALHGIQWPDFQRISLSLPAQLVSLGEQFEAFHNSSLQRTSIHWLHALGNVSVRTNLFCGRASFQHLDLELSTVQACILLLFNERDEITYEEVLRKLLPSEENHIIESEGAIKNSVLSMMTERISILRKSSSGLNLTRKEKIQLNLSFTATRQHIRMPYEIRGRHNDDVNHEVEAARVGNESNSIACLFRKDALESAIVGTMKRNKTMAFKALMKEVGSGLPKDFLLDESDMKILMERLIYMEYLKLDEVDGSVYHYVP